MCPSRVVETVRIESHYLSEVGPLGAFDRPKIGLSGQSADLPDQWIGRSSDGLAGGAQLD